MRTVLSFFTMLLSITLLIGQQSNAIRFNYDNQFINNPAATATLLDMTISAYHQKSFTGINRAPSNSFLGVQIPFRDWNMAGGVSLRTQSIGLLLDNRLDLSYAYKIRLSRNRNQLSVGLKAELAQLRLDGSSIEQSVNLLDPRLSTMSSNGLSTNFGIGINYSSSDGYREGDLVYQFGVAAANVLRNQSVLGDFRFKQTRQLSGYGSIYYRLSDELRFNSLIELQYESTDLMEVRLSANADWYEILSTGLSYDSNGLLSAEVGVYIHDMIGLDNARLLVALSGTLPLAENNIVINQGYGLRVVYSFDVSNY